MLAACTIHHKIFMKTNSIKSRREMNGQSNTFKSIYFTSGNILQLGAFYVSYILGLWKNDNAIVDFKLFCLITATI